jgi:DNA repair exonuclease SbcCD ATPase subunit
MNDFNEEAAQKFYTENPDATPEQVSAFLFGETPDETKGASPDSVKSAEAETKEVKAAADAPKDEPAGIEEDDKEPVVLAKDGKSPIPYAVLSKTRDDLREAKDAIQEREQKIADLEAKLKESTELSEQVKLAQQKDEAAGNTDAMDELIADLEEDYPAAAKLIAKLAGQVEQLSASQKQLDDARKAEEETARIAAEALEQASEFDKEASKLLPEYTQHVYSKEFAEWFDKAPSYIRATANTNDPAVAADVVKTYLKEAKPAAATVPGEKGSDKEQAKPNIDMEKVNKAIKDADEKPAVHSLSDIPGGSNPEHDEANAIKSMDPLALFNKFAGVDKAKMEQMMNRVL